LQQCCRLELLLWAKAFTANKHDAPAIPIRELEAAD
jgi:hypothetical protein